MYRIFCESYANFKKDCGEGSGDGKNSRSESVASLELLTDPTRFFEEKSRNSASYQEVRTLLNYLDSHHKSTPGISSLLWSLEDRGITGEALEVSGVAAAEEDGRRLREQVKLTMDFMKLAYWR